MRACVYLNDEILIKFVSPNQNDLRLCVTFTCTQVTISCSFCDLIKSLFFRKMRLNLCC